jgi:N-succinyldiaminopimelate aminotransferase
MRPPLTPRLAPFGTTIFTEMTELAARHGAVNLGQGFPDFDGPEFVKEAALRAIRDGHNQYVRMFGLPGLNRAVAAHRRRFYGLDYDPDREVTVFSGATEALFATFQALFDAGDEAILFEPFYDSYRPGLANAGARAVVVPLLPPGFALDAEALARAVTPRTRAIVLNSPLNPVGKVFARAELEAVAQLCRRHDLLAITDEVYEHLVFEGEHIPLATLPGMRERTVMISSAGKTFSLTGWKVGYACAPEPLTRALRAAHQFVTFCTPAPFQLAAAAGLEADDAFFARFVADYRARRDRLCAGLAAAGYGVIVPQGTYFAVADIRPLGWDDDLAYCRALPETKGVAAIPVSAFCEEPARVRHLVRFAFCKSDATLDAALARLAG